MDHAVLAGSDLNERAEACGTNDGSFDLKTDLRVVDYELNRLTRFSDHILIGTCDIYVAEIVDIDLDARLVDDLVDRLAAAADNVSDLVGVDIEGDDL